jgi:anti-sigma regulatory factor (Ser/Thr protein kinase)
VGDDEAVELPASPRAPGLARAHVRAVLAQWGLTRLCDEVLLLTTEVVTNALMHTGGASRLRVERVGAGVRVTVDDSSPVLPAVRRPSASATTGRGCRLLTELADSWTAVPHDGGKSVAFVVGGQRDPWAAFADEPPGAAS